MIRHRARHAANVSNQTVQMREFQSSPICGDINQLPIFPSRLRKLCDDVRNQPDQKTKFLKLAEIGDLMPMLDRSSLSAATRIPGCTSITHLIVERNANGSVQLKGYSDAKFARGLLAMVVMGLDGATETVIRSINATDIETACSMASENNTADVSKTTLSSTSSRHNGLKSIMTALHKHLELYDDLNSNNQVADNPERINELLNGRWTDGVQGSDEVAVLLSGGVDSSVALRLAKETGRRVRAFYLKIWLDDESAHLGTECPWEEDMMYARAVCDQAGVQLEDIPLQHAYWNDVVSYTVSEARKGRTPNPDVMCNTRIKFGAFFKSVMNTERFAHVVTGHYARRRTCEHTGRALLRMSADIHKDQTYFLSHLTQDQVARVQFPLGDLQKTQVRQLAQSYGLPNRNRPDSQGICFLGKLKFDEFLALHVGEQLGPLVDYDSGEKVGTHKGFWFFTVGQRKGIGLSGGPWYVVTKNIENNIVYVSRRYHSPEKERRQFQFDSPVWIADRWPDSLSEVGQTAHLGVKIRHGPNMHRAQVTRTGMGTGAVLLENRDKGLALGQFCAFYEDDGTCLGSGIIADEPSLSGAPLEVIDMKPGSKQLQSHL